MTQPDLHYFCAARVWAFFEYADFVSQRLETDFDAIKPESQQLVEPAGFEPTPRRRTIKAPPPVSRNWMKCRKRTSLRIETWAVCLTAIRRDHAASRMNSERRALEAIQSFDRRPDMAVLGESGQRSDRRMNGGFGRSKSLGLASWRTFVRGLIDAEFVSAGQGN